MSDHILTMEHITKIYPNGLVANQDVSLFVKKGEIHALIGENGAGKSTLMKVLFGAERPEQGKLTLRGQEIAFRSPIDAIKAGIGMVYQHFMLVPSLTVAENVVMGAEPTRHALIDRKEAERATLEISQKYNLGIDPKARVANLTIGKKQKVEILKALYRRAEILILDEPTAVLTPQETRELFAQLKQMRDAGLSVIFISHKLKEIIELCDRLTVLRKGRSVATAEVAGITESEITRLIVGREVELVVRKEIAAPKKTALSVRDLVVKNDEGTSVVNGVSFDVRQGEILGVAGVEGNGQSELAAAIAGLCRPAGGSIRINGQDTQGKSVREIRALRFAHIPEDRMVHGVSTILPISDNLISDRFDQKAYTRFGLLRRKKILRDSRELIEKYHVRCEGPAAPVGSLSGGNIQKVVVARECSAEPQVLLASHPTRGIDVVAAEFVRHKLVELRDRDTAVLMISADLDEVAELSDSLIVLHDGQIAAYFADARTASTEELGEYMLGTKKQTPEQVGRACHE